MALATHFSIAGYRAEGEAATTLRVGDEANVINTSLFSSVVQGSMTHRSNNSGVLYTGSALQYRHQVNFPHNIIILGDIS